MSSIRSRNRVLIEFVRGTETRSIGDRVYVDANSAVSLVHKKKVAKMVDGSAPPVEVPEEAPAGDD